MLQKTPGQKLISSVSSVDWAKNISSFASIDGLIERVGRTNYRIAIWAKQLETADSQNSALTFFREAQIQGYYAATLISLALYKPAASAMRGMFESALYYSYFRSHPAELNTLIRDPKFFVDKAAILNFHKKHSVNFLAKQEPLGLLSAIENWYGVLSALVHGQIPGKWVTHKQLSDITFNESVCNDVIATFEEGEQLIHWFLLCTIDTTRWYMFSKLAKDQLLKGLPKDTKLALGLTSN